MSLTFFTTTDGDVILRAGPEPGSKHDFRVHKFILSLASSVFRDMLAFPQPPDQTSDEHRLPVVDVLDPPKVLDTILRFIYPGVEPPNIATLSTLSMLLTTADKYNITSIYPALKEVLKALSPPDSFKAYIIASRFGFLEEAKEAARVARTSDFTFRRPEEIRYISSTDLFRYIQFVAQREASGLLTIQDALGLRPLEQPDLECDHGAEARDYYFRLEKTVEEVYIDNPRVMSKDLFTVLDMVPDPPLGCRPPSRSGEWYYECDEPLEVATKCPLQPMTIRRKLADLAEELAGQNLKLLEEFFGNGVGRGRY